MKGQPIVINGMRYYRLFMPCPVCVGMQEESTPSLYWAHLKDGGDMYIGSDATLYCYKCGIIHCWDNWMFSCFESHGFVSLITGERVEAETFADCFLSANSVCFGGIPRLGVWIRELKKNI